MPRRPAGARQGRRGTQPSALVIYAKNRWQPAIRRCHALAGLAASHGYPVVFVERPVDVRALPRLGSRAFARRLAGIGPPLDPAPGVRALPRATIVPAHRSGVAQLVDSGLARAPLGRALARLPDGPVTVVATVPWQWPAVARLQHVRRVFDCGDDWAAMTPRRRAAFLALYRRIALGADAVVTVSERLAALFPGARPVVVPNGAPAELLRLPVAPPAAELTMAYVGTLTERLDVPLLEDVLTALPSWRLDLYGPCQYAGLGDRPAPELQRLIEAFGSRARWHGPLPRTELAAAIDRAAVCLMPFRRRGAVTGDAMKLYDYAARGRPIVTTRWSEADLATTGAPFLYQADAAHETVTAILAAATEPPARGRARRAWAERHRWEQRWPAWSRALFGENG